MHAHNSQLADVLEAVLPPPGFIAPGAGCTLTISLTPKVGDSHWRQPLVCVQDRCSFVSCWNLLHAAASTKRSRLLLWFVPKGMRTLTLHSPTITHTLNTHTLRTAQVEQDIATSLTLLTPTGPLLLPLTALARRATPCVHAGAGGVVELGARGGGVMVAASAERSVALSNGGALEVAYDIKVGA